MGFKAEEALNPIDFTLLIIITTITEKVLKKSEKPHLPHSTIASYN